MSKLKLRSYQENALKNVISFFTCKTHKQLLVLPTGAGKTILFIAITQHFQKKTLILAHRDELITQAHDKFKKFYPTADVSIYKGTQNSLKSQIIISSVQTCYQPNRLLQLKEEGCFNVMIIDEAHHAASDSYKTIVEGLNFADNKEKLLIGVTATPKRADKKPLKNVFQKITYKISIDKLIQQGYLSPVKGRRILTDFSIEKVKTKRGDFAVGALSEAINTPQRNYFIVSKWKQHANKRKTIAFCVNVQHCKDLAEEFNKQNIPSAAVWGNMPTKERQKTLQDFSEGKISVITSCSLLTEGYDEPTTTCILMARPTKSQSLYQQMAGRGLRLDENNSKKDCLVLDFTDKHNNLKTIISLDDVIPQATVTVEDYRKQSNSKPNEQRIESSRNVDQEFNILGNSKFIWIIVQDEFSLSSDHGDEIIIQKIKHGFIANLFSKNGAFQIVKEPMPLQQCKKICEQFAQRCQTFNYANVHSPLMLEGKEILATQGQVDFLKKNNCYKENISKAEASISIRRFIAQSNYNRRHKKYIFRTQIKKQNQNYKNPFFRR